MATEWLDKLGGIFWAESFWLPQNLTWSEIVAKRDSGEMYLPLPRDLWVPFPIAIGLFIIRIFWERFIALPIGHYFNISESFPRKAISNEVLDKAFKKYGKHPPKHDVILAIAKQADWSVRHVERWWRRRRVQNKAPEMQRFQETSWRFIFYLFSFWYGIAVLWNKEYFWDTRYCWYNYPWQPLPDEIYWYYMIELGFYWSLVLSLSMDVKRKDFVEMIVHHIATIFLMMFSYADGMVRIGALVLIVHDAVDYIMEGAKLANYCKYHKLCDAMFILFAIMWFITRIVIYPLRILKNAYVGCSTFVGTFTGFYICIGLLSLLQILHVLWFYTILHMAYSYIIVGKVEKDERSETEPETNSDDNLVLASKIQVNGNGKDKMAAMDGAEMHQRAVNH